MKTIGHVHSLPCESNENSLTLLLLRKPRHHRFRCEMNKFNDSYKIISASLRFVFALAKAFLDHQEYPVHQELRMW